MNIVFLNVLGEVGGTERALLEILRGLRRMRPNWELHLIVAGEGPLASQAESLGVGVELLPLPSVLARMGDYGLRGGASQWRRWARLGSGAIAGLVPLALYVRRLRSALHRLSPDLIHSNSLKMHVLAHWASPPGAVVIWDIHDYLSLRPIMSRLLRRIKGRDARVIVNSESVARDLKATCGGDLWVRPIHIAVDLNVFSPEGPTLDLDGLAALPPKPPNAIRIGLIAALAAWKGHEIFLKAIAGIPRNCAVRAYVIGDALYRTENSQYSLPQLRAMAAALGLGDRVGFTGYVGESARAMRSLDIVVHASTVPEPFGLVIAEAMACGRAVVASLAGGVPEIVTDGIDALTFPPGNAAVLRDRILQLVREKELRTRLGLSARLTAERRFSAARFIKETVEVYENAVEARVAAAA